MGARARCNPRLERAARAAVARDAARGTSLRGTACVGQVNVCFVWAVAAAAPRAARAHIELDGVVVDAAVQVWVAVVQAARVVRAKAKGVH